MVLFGGNGGSAPSVTPGVWTGSTWASGLPSTSPFGALRRNAGLQPRHRRTGPVRGPDGRGPRLLAPGAGHRHQRGPSSRRRPAPRHAQCRPWPLTRAAVRWSFSVASTAPTTWATPGSGAPPAVTGISPSAGPLAGGTSVTITGLGFNGVTGPPASCSAATTPRRTTSTAPPRSRRWRRQTPRQCRQHHGDQRRGHQPTSAADLFTYQAAPTVTALSPTVGRPGRRARR